MKHVSKGLAACIAVILLAAPVQSAELERPDFPVVVTLAGKIANTNRPPFDPTQDLFLKYHERSFDKAAAFDVPMLEALGLHEVEISVPEWPAPVTVEGPYLKDLLAAVGAEGVKVSLVALDGYASELNWPEIEALNWIVGLRADGKPLGLGQRGPLWVVYTHPDGRRLTAEDELRWPWATFYIEID
jgi:hypothetical protein